MKEGCIMQEEYFNDVKARLKRKEKVSCAWLHMASNVSAEIMANAGFDVLLIDAEHSPVDYQTMLSMCPGHQGRRLRTVCPRPLERPDFPEKNLRLPV